jgi:hypothetical protein
LSRLDDIRKGNQSQGSRLDRIRQNQASQQPSKFEGLQNNPTSGDLINMPGQQPSTTLEQGGSSNLFVDAQKAIYNNTLKPVQDFTNRTAAGFLDGISMGQAKKFLQRNEPDNAPDFVKDMYKPAETTSEKVADVTGFLGGTLAPYSLAYKTAGKGVQLGYNALTKGVNPTSKLGKAALKGGNLAAGGLGAGLGYGVTSEGIDEVINPENKTFGERAKMVALEGLLGAVGDPALRGAAVGLKKAYQSYSPAIKNKINDIIGKFSKGEINEQQLKQEILLLPEGQKLLNAPKTVSKPKYDSPLNKSSDEVLALPEFNPNRNQILDGLFPKVNTPPPYGNPRALREWVVQRVPEAAELPDENIYNFAKQFENVRTPTDQSRQAASNYGFDLDALLQGKVKDLKDMKERKRWMEVVGQEPKEFDLSTLTNRKPVGESPLPFKRERYNPIEQQKLQPFTAKMDPMNKTLAQPIPIKTNDQLLNSLQFGDKIKVRQDRGEVELEFVKREGDTVVVRKRNGKETTVPAQMVVGKNKGLGNNPFKAPAKNEVASALDNVQPRPSQSVNNSIDNSIPSNTEDLLKNSESWKNKATPLLKRETMERNFDDIMGKDAPSMKEQYLEPIKDSEAERMKFLNNNRDEVKNLGIKYKSDEDKLVQMFGEGKISLDELKQQTKDWKKVVKATEVMRNKYDKLLDQLNKALTDNGYDPVPKRENYFPHYEEVDNMFTKLGFDVRNFELPTEIIGRTQNFKPGKNFFAHTLRRKGDKTTFGFIEGFDKYIEGASRVIHHTKNIKSLRQLENDIRAKHGESQHLGSFVTDLQDYTNNLAGKQSALDRGFESAIGRQIYSGLDMLRRRVSLNMIGGNLASAMTNFIPVTQSLATTNKTAFGKGVYGAVSNVFKNDGFIKESKFLTRRYGSDNLARGKLAKTIDASMVFMRGFDRFASNIIVRSKYQEGIDKGLSHDKAMKIADDWAAKIMADRSLGQMPTYFNSKAAGPILQFQLEVNNQLSFLLKDVPRNMKTLQTISALTQVAVYGYLFNELYENAVGRRPALDPIGIAVKAYEDFNNDNIDSSKAAKNTTKEVLGQLPFTSVLTGGRIPLGAAFPNPENIINSEFDNKTLAKESLKPLTYLVSPTSGGQIKKTYQGVTDLGMNPFSPQELTGVYQTNPKGEKYLKYPVEDNLLNKLRGPVFGRNSFPETSDYYDNNRRALGPQQTERVERYPGSYQKIMDDRDLKAIDRKIDEVYDNDKLTFKEKLDQVRELRKRKRNLEEEIKNRGD